MNDIFRVQAEYYAIFTKNESSTNCNLCMMSIGADCVLQEHYRDICNDGENGFFMIETNPEPELQVARVYRG